MQRPFAQRGAAAPAHRSPSGHLADNTPSNIVKYALVHDGGAAVAGTRETRPGGIGNIDLRSADVGIPVRILQGVPRHRRWDVPCELAEPLGVDIHAIEERIHDGTAFASLAANYQDAYKLRIEGSPSFVLNEGRQKLYGNVEFRIIDANIQELLRVPGGDQASWC